MRKKTIRKSTYGQGMASVSNFCAMNRGRVLTIGEIVADTGIPSATVCTFLRRGAGEMKRVARGQWVWKQDQSKSLSS
jgi:hypothetical protein